MAALSNNMQTALRRCPSLVMRLSRLGAFHQSRLSFMRVLTRQLKNQAWRFEQSSFEIDDKGIGHAVYTAHGPSRSYSLVAFSHDLPEEKRSDRVIADAWDATFALFDGVPTHHDIQRLSENVPYQEAGRLSSSELTLSRANRSVRLWTHVLESLANGQQPDLEEIRKVGYLMRTTAVYGSGKFGAADRAEIADREECKPPFQVEMLSVYLIRSFVRDLVQHMANVKGGDKAVALDPAIARTLGIGNSTGLGMAPFILNHPHLFSNWICAREEALAQVRALPVITESERLLFENLLQRVMLSAEHWHTDHDGQQLRIASYRDDLQVVKEYLSENPLGENNSWDRLYRFVESNLSLEGQECIVSLMLEPYGHLIDGFVSCMSSEITTVAVVDGAMSVAEIRAKIRETYDWARALDWQSTDANARAWYVSEEKLEPRLGERHEEPIADYEQPLAPARDAIRLYDALELFDDDTRIAEFLLEHPEHRASVRRVQQVSTLAYGEIYDNTIDKSLMPLDMLRCKLSFFGAIHFDPRSDRWVRIRMFADAPYPEELDQQDAEFWPYPVLDTH